MKKRFTEEQIIGFLREAEAGLPIAELCRKHAFSEASYYLWRSKFGGMSVSDAKRLKELELENSRLKRLLAESILETEVTKEALRKKWWPCPRWQAPPGWRNGAAARTWLGRRASSGRPRGRS